jgi:hypothetical protein
VLSAELLAWLRKGDRPTKHGVDPDALLAAAKALGIVGDDA